MNAEMRVKVKLFIKLLPGYAFFFGSVILVAILYGLVARSIIGMSFLFTGFVSLRYTYNKRVTYHDDSTKRCLLMSVALFSFASLPLITFNIKISLLFSIPLAIGMTWLLYAFGVKKATELELKRLKVPKQFDLDNCTEEELVARCKERFTHDVEYRTERAIKHFIRKLPHEEIDVNPEQSKKERYRFRKILK